MLLYAMKVPNCGVKVNVEISDDRVGKMCTKMIPCQL